MSVSFSFALISAFIIACMVLVSGSAAFFSFFILFGGGGGDEEDSAGAAGFGAGVGLGFAALIAFGLMGVGLLSAG